MIEFPLSKNDWYSLRDDRTKRISGVKGFEDYSVGVLIDSKLTSEYSTQVMAFVTLNILARWCRNIVIEAPEKINCCIHNYKGKNFIDLLRQTIIDIDPHGEFIFDNIKENKIDEIIIIGNSEKKFQKPHVWINSTGWIAGVAYDNSFMQLEAKKDNPIGSLFASCLGVAEVFRHALGFYPANCYSNWYSLYDYKIGKNPYQMKNPDYNKNINFGRIYQIGCGAVGSSFDFILSLMNWKAEIILIDYDNIHWTNCNRSLSFTAYDAFYEWSKINICAKILKNSKILCKKFKGSYHEFIKTGRYFDEPPDLILCLANEKNIWATIQNNFPPIVMHATTTTNWGLNFGRHIPKKEWCIMCRFTKEINHKFVPSCSEVSITIGNHDKKPVYGVLPFLSSTSAVLILSEMAKINELDFPVNGNFIEFSMNSSNGQFSQMKRRADRGCICREQTIDLYPKEIKEGKFWKFVNNKKTKSF